MRREYPAKVLVAWGEAITGNKEIRDWLLKNGYPELGMFVFAMDWNDEARQWLLKKGFPHLLAVIQVLEGDEEAVEWLEEHGFSVLRKMAECGGNMEYARWLVANGHRELAVVGSKLWTAKLEIEIDRREPHKYQAR